MNILGATATYITLSYGTYLADIKVAEQDKDLINHLLTFRRYGQEVLLSWSGPVPLGKEDTKVWIEVFDMECKKVRTVEDTGYGYVGGTVWLCDARLVQEDK